MTYKLVKEEVLVPFKLNSTVELSNKVVMAPLTRCFADDEFVPTLDIEKYYERRSSVGLIISEGTVIAPSGHGYPNTPGIYTEKQIAGWKKVTERVHAGGGKIFMQIWHVGRVSHPTYLNGEAPVAPSAVALAGRIPRTDDLQYATPRALETAEVKKIIEQYKQAAINAVAAGFDGVEIHGANGYLVDQFLHQKTNMREDEYGGSTENRARFALEVVAAVADAIGPHRTGIRLSPGAYFNMEHSDGDLLTFELLLSELSKTELAFVHAGIFDDATDFDYLGGSVTQYLRKHYTGTVIGNGSYTAESGASAIKDNKFDLIAIGRALIANPDYIGKISEGEKLTEYNESMLGSLI